MRTTEACFPRALIFGTENTFRFFLANTRAKGEIVFSSSSEIRFSFYFRNQATQRGRGERVFLELLNMCFHVSLFEKKQPSGGGGDSVFLELLTLGIENVFPCFSLVGKAPFTGIKRTRTRDNLEVF